MRRISIRHLMGVVLAVAVGFSALRASNGYWAGGLLMATLGLLGYAILSCVHGQGPGRAAWLGFLLACGGYLLSVKTLPYTDNVSFPTTLLLAFAHRRFFPLDNSFSLITYTSATTVWPGWDAANPGSYPPPFTTPGTRDATSFFGIGHTLFAWLFGGIGAMVSRRMWRSTAREAPSDGPRGEG